jgi:mannose-6-phosphate isomerase-like protein (cupin superfamily)
MIDSGPNPFVANIEEATLANENYRTTVWTGVHLQMTLMAIQPGHDIGLEVHTTHDQFLRVEQGTGRVQMGLAQDQLTFDEVAGPDFAIIVPAGSWHNVTNVGVDVMKVYSLYAPPQHPHGAVHVTKADADAAEH